MSQPMNPYDSPEAPRPGMSGSTKLLLGLGIGCGVLVLLCCGGFVGMSYYFGKSLQNAVTKDPAKIREITDKIVTIAIPESLPPVLAMEFVVPLVNMPFITWVQYGEEHGENMLGLAQFNEQLDERQMRSQWQQSMQQNGQRGYDEIDVEMSETVEQEVNGQPASFNVAQGHDRNSKAEVWQVSGTFHGKGGPALLHIKVSAEEFTKDQVLDILKSMK